MLVTFTETAFPMVLSCLSGCCVFCIICVSDAGGPVQSTLL